MAMSNKTLRPRVSGFNPKSISGLVGWYDGADATTLVLTSGFLSQWTDKSDSARHLTQATANARPVTGGAFKGSPFFTTNDFLVNRTDASSTCLKPATVFMAFNKPAAAAGCVFAHVKDSAASYDSEACWMLDTNSNGNQIKLMGGTATSLYSGLGLVGDVLNSCISSVIIRSTEQRATLVNHVASATVNDTSYTITSGSVNNGIMVGAFGFNGSPFGHFAGYIMEILIFGNEFNDANKTKVVSYLSKKWGIAAT